MAERDERTDRSKPETASTLVFNTSVKRQELSADRYLSAAHKQDVSGISTPVIGGIPLLSKLGEGGMGAVYVGMHPRLQTEVAVKILAFGRTEGQSERVQRFFREARICARIKSPHLAAVIDVNEENGLFYLVMEFVNGPSAGAHLREVRGVGRRGLDENVALDICIAGAEGLAVLHRQGVVHRDVKPDNILIPKDKDGALNFAGAKLSDLGLAHSDDGEATLTQTGAVFGTPGFLAPEQAGDSRSAGAQADIFGMGATLYALLSGQAPFGGNSALEAILATQRKAHTPIRELRPELSAKTVALIDRCLAKDPGARYPDGARLLAALQQCRAAPSARPIAKQQATPKPDRPVVESAGHGVKMVSTATKQRRGLLAVVLLMILAGGAWLCISMLRSQAGQTEHIDQTPPSPPAVVNSSSTPPSTAPAAPAPEVTALDLGQGVKLELTPVPAGVLDLSPDRRLNIAAFSIGKYPVTVAQFRRFVLEGRYVTEAETAGDGQCLVAGDWQTVPGASWKNVGFAQEDDHPVVMVTLADAEAFAQWASQRTGKNVALPVEVEWTYAARHNDPIDYPWGNGGSGSAAADAAKFNHADLQLKKKGIAPVNTAFDAIDDGYAFTSPAGHYNNAGWCGAFDMAGNVWQWCLHPKGATADNPRRGWARGGSWCSPPEECRVYSRRKFDDKYRSSACGFRIVVRPK